MQRQDVWFEDNFLKNSRTSSQRGGRGLARSGGLCFGLSLLAICTIYTLLEHEQYRKQENDDYVFTEDRGGQKCFY